MTKSKRLNFLFSMSNLWNSLGFLSLGIYSLIRGDITFTIAMVLLSLFYFLVWASFIYRFISRLNLKDEEKENEK